MEKSPEETGEKLRKILKDPQWKTMSGATEQQESSLLHFGDFTLDLKRRGLYRGQQRVHLTSKPLETLIVLIECRGRVVEKRELLDRVWKDTFVTEDNLVHAIREIRRALEDDKEDPRFIQTVPRQGYTFISEVSFGETSSTAMPVDQGSAALPAPGILPESRFPRWPWISALVVLALVMVAGVFWVRERRRVPANAVPAPATGSINKQVTTGEFSTGKPAFSPDGKFILYVSSSEETRGFGDLFIKQFPEGNAQRITNKINPSGDLPVFTADGNHVVFSIPRIGQDGVRHHDLWIVPSFGGPPARFIEDASGAGFSPDQKWVAYTKHLGSRDALWINPANDLQDQFEASETGYTPRWSPNGEWLAYSTSNPSGGRGNIRIAKVSRSSEGRILLSEATQVTRDPEEIYGLTWTADSKSIIFSSKRSGPSQLYRVSVTDGSTTPLLSGVGNYIAPSASPDGSAVIFQYFRLTNDLMTSSVEANSSESSCEAKNITFQQFHASPRISPSGEKLVSVIRQIDNTERLYLTDLKTGEGSQLSERAAHHPSWLNNESVVFLSSDASSDQTEVLVVNTATRESRSLTTFSGKAHWLAIHPDGKRLAVVMKGSDQGEKILVRDLSNGTDSTLHERSEYEHLRWSPNGSSLTWDKPGASRNAPELSAGIWMMTLGKSEPQLLTGDGYCPVWKDDGSAIYFGTRRGQQGLWLQDLAKGKPQFICNWEGVFNYDLVGQRLVFAQHGNNSQVYSMTLP